MRGRRHLKVTSNVISSVKIRIKKSALLFVVGTLLLFPFQNCGKFNLRKPAQFSSFSSNIDMTLRPPTDYAWNRRYIFLVDMSYSMVSGPCPFDVDVTDSVHGFTGAYKDYDPNFPSEANFADARARVADCSVDPRLDFGQMVLDYSQPQNSSYLPNHKTFKGADFDGNRFRVLRAWINQMRESTNVEFRERTEILLVPGTAGLAYERLLADYPLKELKFVNLNDPLLDSGINYLEQVHRETATMAQMPSSQRFSQYDPDLDKLKMGTTHLAFELDQVFTSLDKDMEKLALLGALTHSTYKMFTLGDSTINPFDEHFDKALQYFSSCVDCLDSLEIGWGKKQNNTPDGADLKLSLVQGLNKYYGSGFFEADILKIENRTVPDSVRYTASAGSQTLTGTDYPADQKDVLRYLHQKSGERRASTRFFELAGDVPPFYIANNNSEITTYKTTHVFLLNANFKVDANGAGLLDSDGDGLPDEKESLYSLNPQLARSNGICLDSLMTEAAYQSRCESLYQSKLCNPQLDSDGDSLNECEEMTIGTDPFDFDTDGDGVPDSLEVLYSMNPVADDSKADSNGDGLTNLMNLGKGFNPSVLPRQVLDVDTITILLDFVSQQNAYNSRVGDIKTDSFKLDLVNFPLRMSYLTPSPLNASFLVRPGSKGFNASTAQIPADQLLIKPISAKFTNKLLGLIRVVDPDEPLRVYWESFELDMDTRQSFSAKAVDLSRFSQMKVIDRVRVAK